MKVKLYKNFKKRKNSTLQPSGDFLEVDCTLKNGTSIVNPTIQLQLAFNSDYSNYNYCHIPDFGRYYYIRDLVWNNSIAEFVLVSDIMASFKSDIASFTGLAVRLSANYDGFIADNIVVPTDDYTITSQRKEYFSNITVNNLGYVIQYAGAGGVGYAYLTAELMNQLCQQLGSTWSALWGQFGAFSKCYKTFLTKSQIGASADQYVISAGVGTEQCTFNGYRITLEPKTFYLFNDFNLSDHSQSSVYGKFLNSQRYREFYLLNSGIGLIKLPTIATDSGAMGVRVVFSPDTGKSVLEVVAGDRIITTANTRLYAEIPFIGQAINVSGVAGGAIGTISGIGSALAATTPTGAIAAGLGAGVSAISGAVSAFPTAETRGGVDGIASLDPTFILYTLERRVTQSDNSNQGRPYCRQYKASSGGYIEYERVNLSTNARADEKSEIETTMERGFYYE